MKDIKALYLAAKHSKRDKEISSYSEAVNEACSNPNEYLTQLEYIISSEIGLATLKPFIESHGLPIMCHSYVSETVDKCIAKCNEQGISPANYESVKKYLDDFRTSFINEFAMFESYAGEIDLSSYVSTYYGTTNGKSNRSLIRGMISKYAEAAVPDIMIMAKQLGSNATEIAIKECVQNNIISTPTFYEWMNMIIPADSQYKSLVESNSLSAIIAEMKSRNNKVFTEAAIMGNEDAELTYAESELNALHDMISFKEYLLTWSDELGIPVMESQSAIYDLYEEFDGMIFEDVDKTDTKDNEEYVPFYCVLQSYSHSDTDNRGNKKNDIQKGLADANKLIRFLSRGDKYTHALIALDTEFDQIYSFGSQGFERAPIDEDDLWLTTDSVYVSAIFVTKSDFNNIKKFIMNMKVRNAETKYAYSNMVRMLSAKTINNSNINTCSSFSALVLQLANPKLIHRDYSRCRPEDLTIIPRSFYVMTFKDRDDFHKKKDQFKARVKAIEEEHLDEIKDYNNALPKIMLKEQMDKLRTFDKIINWFASKTESKFNYKKRV